MKDGELMQLADGELDDRELPADERAKVDAIGELGELVRGHAEMAADAVPQKRFDAMWREIDKAIDGEKKRERESTSLPVAAPAGFWRRVGRWFDQYRGHLITGAVSAGAVAALALVLRGSPAEQPVAQGSHNPDPNLVQAVYHPTEIESLDTPGGTGTVFDLKDEDGDTTVIWVTPNDTVEGL